MNTIYDEIDAFCHHVHEGNVKAGWWSELEDVLAYLPAEEERLRTLVEAWFLATKIALIHSEASEMLEGLRKGQMDDHLPHLSQEETEGADIFIRLADYMGRRKFGLGTSTLSKQTYNAIRPDHTDEDRKKPGGKLF